MTESDRPVEVGIYGVTKRFGDMVAVDDVTIEVARGEFFSLLGPSGCGKTTSLRMIAGFEEPDEGRVVLTGHDIVGRRPPSSATSTPCSSRTRCSRISPCRQRRLRAPRRKKSAPRPTSRDRVKRYLDLVELKGYDDRRPSQLSGGQQQRVALGAAPW